MNARDIHSIHYSNKQVRACRRLSANVLVRVEVYDREASTLRNGLVTREQRGYMSVGDLAWLMRDWVIDDYTRAIEALKG